MTPFTLLRRALLVAGLLAGAGRSHAQAPKLTKEATEAYKWAINKSRYERSSSKLAHKQEVTVLPGQPLRLPLSLQGLRVTNIDVIGSGPLRLKLHPDPRTRHTGPDKATSPPDSVAHPGGHVWDSRAPAKYYRFIDIKLAADRQVQLQLEADAPTLVQVLVYEFKMDDYELREYDPKAMAAAQKRDAAIQAQRDKDYAARQVREAQAAGVTLTPGRELTAAEQAAIQRERMRRTRFQISCTLSDKNHRDTPEQVEKFMQGAWRVPGSETGELVCLRRDDIGNATPQMLSFTAEAGYHYLFALSIGYLKGGPNGIKSPDEVYVGVRNAAGTYLAGDRQGSAGYTECNFAFQADTPITVVYSYLEKQYRESSQCVELRVFRVKRQ